MERIDDLQYHGLLIIQDPALACFSEDAVLLAHFLRAGAGDRVVDLGAGNGVISILGAALTGASFVGVECQPALCDMAARSASLNRQEIPFHCLDVSDAPAVLGHGSFSAAVMNPPYFSDGEESANPSRAAARHGGSDVLDRFLQAAFLLLKNGGRLFCSYPADRTVDLFCAMRARRLEPKRVRFLGKRVLAEGRKDGKPGLCLE